LKKLVLIIAVAAFMITGCATTAPKRPFTEITNIPQGKGVVYIYMTKQGGKINNLEVRVDNSSGIGTYVGNILQGTYIPYIAPIGENMFHISNKVVTINVNEGNASFIWAKIVPGFFAPKLKPVEVDPTAGIAHIQKTQQR